MKTLANILEKVLSTDINISIFPDIIIQYLAQNQIGWAANGESVIDWYKQFDWWKKNISDFNISKPGKFNLVKLKMYPRDTPDQFTYNFTTNINKKLCLGVIDDTQVWGIFKQMSPDTYLLKAFLKTNFDTSNKLRNFGLEMKEQDGYKIINVQTIEDIEKALKSIR